MSKEKQAAELLQNVLNNYRRFDGLSACELYPMGSSDAIFKALALLEAKEQSEPVCGTCGSADLRYYDDMAICNVCCPQPKDQSKFGDAGVFVAKIERLLNSEVYVPMANHGNLRRAKEIIKGQDEKIKRLKSEVKLWKMRVDEAAAMVEGLEKQLEAKEKAGIK